MAVWVGLLAVGYSVGGTLVLRRIDYRTPLAVGFLLGVGVMMVRASGGACVVEMRGWGLAACFERARGAALSLAFSFPPSHPLRAHTPPTLLCAQINMMLALAVMSGGGAAMFSKDSAKLPAVRAVVVVWACARAAALLPPPPSLSGGRC